MNPAKLLKVAICVAALGLSGYVAYQTVDTLWIRGLAARLEAKEIRNDLPPSRDERWQAVSSTKACDSETLYAGLVVMLLKLDQVNVTTNPKEWATGMDGGERFLKHVTDCLPSDGNAWLRLAMVQRAIAEQPDEICTLVEKSRAYAPFEALTLSARIRLYKRLNKVTVSACSDVIRRDFQTVFVNGARIDFKDWLANLDPALQTIADEELAKLDEPRRQRACKEYRHFKSVEEQCKKSQEIRIAPI